MGSYRRADRAIALAAALVGAGNGRNGRQKSADPRGERLGAGDAPGSSIVAGVCFLVATAAAFGGRGQLSLERSAAMVGSVAPAPERGVSLSGDGCWFGRTGNGTVSALDHAVVFVVIRSAGGTARSSPRDTLSSVGTGLCSSVNILDHVQCVHLSEPALWRRQSALEMPVWGIARPR